ncbi:MAG: hypothetical protein PHP32_03055 [Candidatus Izemoplasmatales bacterium]|nr:hypothetical protein [Candidatus Izemoplasmatales bacterium]
MLSERLQVILQGDLEERLPLLSSLYSQADETSDAALFEIALALSNAYVEIQDFDSAIDLLQTLLRSERTEDHKTILSIMDALYAIFLKTENFEEMGPLLEQRLRFVGDNRHQQMIQSFYLAVHFEGLQRDEEAISALESIPDTMSASNQISKYLKLAMLRLKRNEIQAAQEAYDHATRFDSSKKNPLFQLVASDLAYATHHAKEALASYETYFLQSKVRNRYLDRYLIITHELGMDEDGLRFYHVYEPRMQRSMSKHHRRCFYEAALPILQKLGSSAEIGYANDQLSRNEPELSIISDAYDAIQKLISLFSSPPVFDKPRDVLLFAARSLFSIYPFPQLSFVTLDRDGYVHYRHVKGLLMEKRYRQSDIEGSLAQTLFESFPKIGIFSEDEVAHLTNPFLREDPQTPFVFAIRFQSESFGKAYMVIAIKDGLHYDYLHKLCLTAATLLEQLLALFSREQTLRQRIQEYAQKDETLKIGRLVIRKGKIEEADDIAKSIFGIDKTPMLFEEIQANFITKTYLDDFLRHSMIERHYRRNDQERIVRLDSIWHDADLTLFLQDVTDSHQQRKEQLGLLQNDIFEDAESLRELKKRLEEHHRPSAIISIHMESRLRRIRRFGILSLHQWETRLFELTKHTAKEKHMGICRSLNGGWLWYVASADRRVIERIISSLEKEISTNMTTEMVEPLRFVVMIIHGPKSFTTILSQIEEALAEQNSKNSIHFVDQRAVQRQSVFKTIALNVRQMLSQKSSPLAFRPITDEHQNAVIAYQVEFDESIMLGDSLALQTALNIEGLSKAFDMHLLKSLSEHWKKQGASSRIRLFIPIHHALWEDSTLLEQQLKKLKRSHPDLPTTILLLSLSDVSISEVMASIAKVRQHGFGIAIHEFETISMDDLSKIGDIAAIFVKEEDLPSLSFLSTYQESAIVYQTSQSNVEPSQLTLHGISAVLRSDSIQK